MTSLHLGHRANSGPLDSPKPFSDMAGELCSRQKPFATLREGIVEEWYASPPLEQASTTHIFGASIRKGVIQA